MSLSADRIAWVRGSSCVLQLATPISDAEVLTGRQKPMTEIVMLFAEVQTADGHEGLGFSWGSTPPTSSRSCWSWASRSSAFSAFQAAEFARWKKVIEVGKITAD